MMETVIESYSRSGSARPPRITVSLISSLRPNFGLGSLGSTPNCVAFPSGISLCRNAKIPQGSDTKLKVVAAVLEPP
eukprot:COSAG02_NODE_15960_length_1125_cov_2.021442_1_plen_77_part_00